MGDLALRLNVSPIDLKDEKAFELETLFKIYFTDNGVTSYEYALKTLIDKLNSLESKQSFALSTQKLYPQKSILLTRAIVHLISTYGLDKHYYLTPKAIRLLRSPQLMELAHKNNSQLIYEINKAVRDKEAEDEIEKSTGQFRQFILNNRKEFKQHKKVTKQESNALERETRAFSRFFYYMEHPLEEEQMQASLKHLIEDFSLANADKTILHAYLCKGRYQWFFLNTVYGYLRTNNDLEGFKYRLNLEKTKYQAEGKRDKAEGIENLIEELELVDKTHLRMEAKTKNQSVWMMIAGAMFGMEFSMLALEAIALMTPLGAWVILGVSLGACALLGPFIANQFYTAHYDELMKMNQRDYFNAHLPKEAQHESHSCSWGTAVAKIGTLQEGIAAGTLLLTLGAFAAFDLVAWGIKGGDYTLPVPGLYFITEVAFASTQIWVPIVSAVAAVALLYMAYKATSALANAHLALDGMKTIEYYDKRKEEAAMRGVLNANTAAPLYYSRTLELKDKVLKTWEGLTEISDNTPNHSYSIEL